MPSARATSPASGSARRQGRPPPRCRSPPSRPAGGHAAKCGTLSLARLRLSCALPSLDRAVLASPRWWTGNASVASSAIGNPGQASRGGIMGVPSAPCQGLTHFLRPASMPCRSAGLPRMCPPEHDSQDAPSVTAPEALPGLSERIPRFLLSYSPLGALVRRVARLRASVHAKLLGAFLLIALLLIAMGAMSLQSIASVARHSRLLDQARERVDASRQIEQALSLQMNFTRNALLVRDDATIESVFRENNRFLDTFNRLEAAVPPEQRDTIRRIRAGQEQVMATVARIAELIREGKGDDAMELHVNEAYPVYREIATLVTQAVRTEEEGMRRLREGVEVAYRRAFVLTASFAAASIFLALVLGFVISWSFILPVRQAEGFLGRVAKGDFSASIDVVNRDEFGTLAGRMNHMSQELHQLYDEQRRAGHQLQVLNDELARASQAKSEFLANMSHEPRTPLNAIIGFSEVLGERTFGELTHLGATSPVPDQRHPRSLEDRGRAYGAGAVGFRPARGRGQRGDAGAGARRAPGRGPAVDGRGRRRRRARGRAEGAPGGVEPALQRDQVHPRGRTRRCSHRPRRRRGRGVSERYRGGHRARASGRSFRGVPPGRGERGEARGHGAGARAVPQVRGAPWREDLGREPGGQGLDLHLPDPREPGRLGRARSC